MGRKLVRTLLWILAVEGAAWVAGRIISKNMTRGDEGSDVFRVAAICGPRRFRSRAGHLKSGTAITSMGGTDLDLRGATLDPSGAELELRTTMGGVQVVVPPDWVVEVDRETMAGGFEVRVTPPENLPSDAPRLHIHAVTRLGGGVVTSEAA